MVVIKPCVAWLESAVLTVANLNPHWNGHAGSTAWINRGKNQERRICSFASMGAMIAKASYRGRYLCASATIAHLHRRRPIRRYRPGKIIYKLYPRSRPAWITPIFDQKAICSRADDATVDSTVASLGNCLTVQLPDSPLSSLPSTKLQSANGWPVMPQHLQNLSAQHKVRIAND